MALSFEGSLDVEVHADPHKLRQALDNVLANALKFTPRGGRVRVRVGREAGPHPLTVFEIADTGPGIPRRPTGERIFDRYKQGSRGRAAGLARACRP